MRLERRPEDQAHERPETSIRIKTIRINRYFNGLLGLWASSRTELDNTELTTAVFHRPHPQKETDKGAVKSLRKFLTVAEVTPWNNAMMQYKGLIGKIVLNPR